MQPFYVLLGLFADGNSRIFDYEYPEEVKYCEEINKILDNSFIGNGKITTNGSK